MTIRVAEHKHEALCLTLDGANTRSGALECFDTLNSWRQDMETRT